MSGEVQAAAVLGGFSQSETQEDRGPRSFPRRRLAKDLGVDLEAFTFLYPLADAALIRKMEGAEITLERLTYVTRATQSGVMRDQVFSAFVGDAPREDFIPYTADFFLQLEDVKWTIVAGVVNGTLIVSV